MLRPTFADLKASSETYKRVRNIESVQKASNALKSMENKMSLLENKISDLERSKADRESLISLEKSLDKQMATTLYNDMQMYVDETMTKFYQRFDYEFKVHK